MPSGWGSGEPAAESRGGVWAAQDGLAVEDPRSVCGAQGTGASIPLPTGITHLGGCRSCISEL